MALISKIAPIELGGNIIHYRCVKNWHLTRSVIVVLSSDTPYFTLPLCSIHPDYRWSPTTLLYHNLHPTFHKQSHYSKLNMYHNLTCMSTRKYFAAKTCTIIAAKIPKSLFLKPNFPFNITYTRKQHCAS